jgi:hypothetical protein
MSTGPLSDTAVRELKDGFQGRVILHRDEG